MPRDYDREMWGNLPPWERPKWARFLRVQRGTETQEAFLRRLAKWGRPLKPTFYSDMERGKAGVNSDWQEVFRSFLGRGPEDWDDPWDQEPAAEGNVTALIAAIDRLVQSQAELTAELREARLGGPARLATRAVEAATAEAERVGGVAAAPSVAARAPARRGRR